MHVVRNYKNWRLKEFKTLTLRVLTAFMIYTFLRVLFFVFNYSYIEIDSFLEFLQLCFIGLMFDTTAILYLSLPFILLSILPLGVNRKPKVQKLITYLYFIPHFVGLLVNVADLKYYVLTKSRITWAVFDIIENEENTTSLIFSFLRSYSYLLIILGVLFYVWIYIYNKIKLDYKPISRLKPYLISSLVLLLVVPTLVIGGIRGGYKYSTRPINMIDATRYVKNISQADLILNSTFTLIRTFKKNEFKKKKFFLNDTVKKIIKPIKHYSTNIPNYKNVVVFILESFGSEYLGAFSEDKKIANYKSYSPFLDSLAQKSLVLTNAFANGRQSIHGMSSILAGIPSFKVAYTSSPYANQEIQSLVSELNKLGYDTSFFHGAPNGSMGFLGFSNILKFDNYYGKNEFNNNAEFDGIWGIWDEPFFNYMAETISTKKQPFMATMFSLTSHDPYKVPSKYKNQFPLGNIPMHKCIGYTDYALRQFFEKVKYEEWFKNTVFVFTADHTNVAFYNYYKKSVNRYSIPIMFYLPDSDIKGKIKNVTQQIDIYPTVLDLIGYNRSFRSWGRSLLRKDIVPFAITYGNLFYYINDSFICTFDGEKAVGFYDFEDKNLVNNLIKNRTKEMNQIELLCKAFIQDYMQKIIDKEL